MACPYFSDDVCLIPDNGMYIPLSLHRENYCLAYYAQCVRYKKHANPFSSNREDERRKFTRIRKIFPCAGARNPAEPDSFTLDMSLGGMRLMTGKRLTEGECYDFWLYGPDKKQLMDVSACVQWTKPSFINGWYETGMAFMPGFYEEHADQLTRIINE